MQPRTKRLLLIGGAALLFLALVVAVPVGVTQSRKSSSTNALAAAPGQSESAKATSAEATPTTAAAAPSASTKVAAVISGKGGSTVTLGNGSDVTYVNGFGGDWVWDETDPWGKKDGALGGGRAQEWSKRSGEDWVWGVDQVRGVSQQVYVAFSTFRRQLLTYLPLSLACCRSTSVRPPLSTSAERCSARDSRRAAISNSTDRVPLPPVLSFPRPSPRPDMTCRRMARPRTVHLPGHL